MTIAPSTAIEKHASSLPNASTWAMLNPEERKRRAVQAARDRDEQTLWGLLEAHLTLFHARATGISPHTLRAYKLGFQQLINSLAGESILQPSEGWAGLYRANLSQHYAPATCMVRLAAARAFYAALRWAKSMSIDPLRDVKGIQDPTPPWEKREAYSEAELERLLEVGDVRERLIVLLGAHGGLRAGEISRLTVNDINFVARTLRVMGKGGKVRTVKISLSLLNALNEYQPKPQQTTLLGVGATRLWQIVTVLCQKASTPDLKIEPRGVHSLRHSSGTRLYRATRDVVLVRDHLGHASARTSERYAKRDQRLVQEIESW